MTRLAKDIVINVIGELVDMDRCQDELDQMDLNGEFSEDDRKEAVVQADEYFEKIKNGL